MEIVPEWDRGHSTSFAYPWQTSFYTAQSAAFEEVCGKIARKSGDAALSNLLLASAAECCLILLSRYQN
jgi:hypothetical protein